MITSHTQKMIESGKQAADIVRQDVLEACEKEGLTLRGIARVIREATEATSIKQNVVMVEPGKFEWMESNPVIDYATRLKAASLARDILGMDAPKQSKVDVTGVKGLSSDTEDLVKKLVGTVFNQSIALRGIVYASLKHFAEDDDQGLPATIDLIENDRTSAPSQVPLSVGGAR